MGTQTKDERISLVKVVTFGAIAGVVSWSVVPVVSGKFEPFDSGVGLFANQIVLSIPAALVAWRYRLSAALMLILCSWLAMNAYGYIFGGSEQRAWWVLGAVVRTSLFAAPLVVAFCALAIRKIQQARK